MRATKVNTKKRARRDPDTSRRLILDATEEIMVDEGYASVTMRRIAKHVGINSALVHYYYPTIDDLFAALHLRMTEQQLKELEAVFNSDDPLRAFWGFQTNWAQSKLAVEFLGLANHRPSLKDGIAGNTEQARNLQAKALRSYLVAPKAAAEVCSPIVVVTLLVGIARMLVNEENIGIAAGHAEARAFVEWALKQVSPSK